jgi:MFS family permease
LPVYSLFNRSFRFLLRQERAFKINLVRNISQNFFLTATQQYQSIFIVALGANAIQLGFGTAIGGIASVGAALFVGWLSNRYRIKSIFMLGVALIAAGSLFFATAIDWWMVIPALAVMTFALRVTSTVCPTICGSCFRSHERATGMAACDVVSSLPRLAAPVLAAYLVTVFGGLNAQGIRPLYFVQLAGLCLTFMMIWKLFRDPREMTLARAKRIGDGSFIRNMKRLFSETKHVKSWIVYMSLVAMPIYLSGTYWALFAAQVKGADQYVIGQMTMATWVIPIAFSFPMGKLADVIGRKRAIYLFTPLLLFSMFMLVYARSSSELIVSTFLFGTIVLISTFQTAMTTEMVPPQLLSTWLSVLAIFDGIVGLVIAPVIGGLIWDAFSPTYVIFLMIGTTIAAIPLFLFMPETLKKQSKQTVN